MTPLRKVLPAPSAWGRYLRERPPPSLQVDVSDAGEPGRDDVFALTLSTGYAASGTLQGGSIQMHNCQ